MPHPEPGENPYAPGAGALPPFLAGRGFLLDMAKVDLRLVLEGRSPGRAPLLTGRRGVGKTVLLHDLAQEAERLGYVHEHIELAQDESLPARVATALHHVLLQLEATQPGGPKTRQALGALKAFTRSTLSLSEAGGPTLRLDVAPAAGTADSGELSSDLAWLFMEVGRLAQARRAGVLLTIDEIHYAPLPVSRAVVASMWRTKGQGLPITMAAAALPSLPSPPREAWYETSLLYAMSEIGPLTRQGADEALTEPAARLQVVWERPALDAVWRMTDGVPYFVQEFGRAAWTVARGRRTITADDVRRAAPMATARLDDGFFARHTGTLPQNERHYLRAMAELAPGPVRSSEVARLLGKTTSQLGPVRDALVKRGVCYAPKWGEIDFTAPQFGEFVRRWIPELETQR